MSANDRLTLALAVQLAQVADGALLGIGLAYVAVNTLIKCFHTSSALKKIRDAPSVSVSDLRSILSPPADDSTGASADIAAGGEILVVVRGAVDAKSAVEASLPMRGWMNVRLLSTAGLNAGQDAVIVQKVQSCIYQGLVGFMPWTSDIRSILNRAWKEESSYTKAIPFVLKQGGEKSQQNYVVVNMEGSKHPLPLVTVYHEMKPIKGTPYMLLQALFGREYAVGHLEEEKILPTGREITAVGVCCLKGGVPEIKSCNNLPYFLCDMSKHQIIADLTFRTKVLTWSSVVLGSASLALLGYAIVRNWKRWRDWRQQARINRGQNREVPTNTPQARINRGQYREVPTNTPQARIYREQNREVPTNTSQVRNNRGQNREVPVVEEEEEEEEDVPEGQLCVLCLRYRRQSAFVPCGHLICCRRCASKVESEPNPKCPICRQSVRNSVRIYSS